MPHIPKSQHAVVSALLAGAIWMLPARDANAQWVANGACPGNGANAASATAYRDHIIDDVLIDGATGLAGTKAAAAGLPAAIQTCRAFQAPANVALGNFNTCMSRVEAYSLAMGSKATPGAPGGGGYTGLGLVQGPGAYGYVAPMGGPGPFQTLTNANYVATYSGGAGVGAELDLPACLTGGALASRQALLTRLRAVKLAHAATIPTQGELFAAGGPGPARALLDGNSITAAIEAFKDLCPTATVAAYVTTATPGIDAQGPGGTATDRDRQGRIIAAVPPAAPGPGAVTSFIQFTVDTATQTNVPYTNGNPVQPGRQQMSIVNVVTPNPPRLGGAHVYDYKRDNDNNTFVHDATWGNNQACYGCHANGFIPISPFQGSGLDLNGVLNTIGPAPSVVTQLWSGDPRNVWLAALNTRFAPDIVLINALAAAGGAGVRGTYNAPTRAGDLAGFPPGFIDPVTLAGAGHAGAPLVGDACVTAANTLRQPDVRQWSVMNWGWSYWDYTYQPQILGAALTCAGGCHGNTRLAAVSDAWDAGEGFAFMMSKYLRGALMPPAVAGPGHPVSLQNRTAATACYLTDQQRQVRAWLKGTVCP